MKTFSCYFYFCIYITEIRREIIMILYDIYIYIGFGYTVRAGLAYF